MHDRHVHVSMNVALQQDVELLMHERLEYKRRGKEYVASSDKRNVSSHLVTSTQLVDGCIFTVC